MTPGIIRHLEKPLRVIPFLAVLLLLQLATATLSAESDDEVYFPIEIKTELGLMPACTPVELVASTESAKTDLITGVASVGPWGRFSIKAKSARTASNRLEDCLTDHLKHSGYKADTVIPQFIAGRISPGMPIEFAVAHLGPEDKRSMKEDGTRQEYSWKRRDHPTETHDQMATIRVGLFPVALLSEASSIKIVADRKTGRMRAIELAYPTEQLKARGDRARQLDGMRASYNTGLTHYDNKDPASAIEIWQQLAADGYAPAQYSLADLYLQGEGLPSDPVAGSRLMKQAAKGQFPPAQYHLGYLYTQGEGVTRDLLQAYYWMTIAEFLGNESAATARESIQSSLTKEQLATVREQLDEAAPENPKLILHVEPGYPELARVARLEGSVVLQAMILEDGHVTDLEVIRSNRPNMGFEKGAIDAVKLWRFEPATILNVPVAVYFTVFVDFKLH